MGTTETPTPKTLPPARTGRADDDAYTVVARRYRPQRLEDVVGQDHVVDALRNAIQAHRIAHAYLFCGTRGVGKTSMARIFAKCLNCVKGPTIHPCLECDVCQAIAAGQDVDVIEIDGASNNGVDAVRELRQNAGLRPSRSRFKIYYIDEVHMLSTGAFNALLKTLEEPPEHVKFLFATTEAHKIPVTVLSRCQKFDFAPIGPDAIASSLEAICRREGVETDDEALRVIARRAAGSMRDAQSLLEQLLSAGKRNLGAGDVQRILGMADDEHVLDLLDALADRDPARALTLLDRAVVSGSQPADVLGGSLEFLRDALVLGVGAGEVELLATTPARRARVEALAGRWGLDSMIAAMQVLDSARGRLRGSPHGRLIVELALFRVGRLENLTDLADLIGRLGTLEATSPLPTAASSADSAEKKKPEPAPELDRPPAGRDRQPHDPAAPLTIDRVEALWPTLLDQLPNGLATAVKALRPSTLSGDQLAVRVEPGYNWVADRCDSAEARVPIESALRGLFGRPLSLWIERAAADPPATPTVSVQAVNAVHDDPFVQKVVELFEARLVRTEAEDPADP